MIEPTSINLNQERYITEYYKCKGCTGVSCKLNWKQHPSLFSRTNSAVRIPVKYRNCNLVDKYYSSRCKLCQVGNSISNYKTREGMIRRGRSLQELKDEFGALLITVNKIKRRNGEMLMFVRSGLYDDIREEDVKIRTEDVKEEDVKIRTEDVIKIQEDFIKIQEEEVKIQEDVIMLQCIIRGRCKKLMEINRILEDVKNKLSM